MGFWKRAVAVVPAAAAGGTEGEVPSGVQAEDQALAHLQRHGLKLVERNYRLARGPSRRAGEIDLILRDRDGTLVFVEVRARRGSAHGGAAASVTRTKQQKLIYAARAYLLQFATLPPCRFDVVAIDDGRIEWLKAAFDAA
ncbi:MAG TPA: YraN family protein [Ideonella sp.]|uniref:YraN family protein n=1 Tax=Ideonella sp. TaxID=1929293 RepID=UPI002D0283CA|nr:YraN family protein [Ideonella sp.]HSI48198.1 YraN family protein [Ideonella sp.]